MGRFTKSLKAIMKSWDNPANRKSCARCGGPGYLKRTDRARVLCDECGGTGYTLIRLPFEGLGGAALGGVVGRK